MRFDMAEVIVERPRYYSRGVVNKPIGRRSRQDISDEAPKGESMRQGWLHHKEQNENPQPLRRYLYSQAGRQWNDVYGDICRRLKAGGASQNRLLDYVRRYVMTDAIWINGEAHDLRGRKLPNVNSEALFVVRPQTAVLEALPKLPRYRHVPPPARLEQISLDETHKLVKVCGLWWEIAFQKVEPHPHFGYYGSCFTDLILQNDPKYADSFGSVSYWELLSEWGAGMVAVSRRQLNKREIRRLTKTT